MKKIFAILALLLGLALQPSDASATASAEVGDTVRTISAKAAVALQDSAAYIIDGKIYKTDLEAGCYYLDSAGTKYMLVGPDEALNKVLRLGQDVELVVKPDNETVTACRVGPVLRIVAVIRVEKPKRSSSEYKPKTQGDVVS